MSNTGVGYVNCSAKRMQGKEGMGQWGEAVSGKGEDLPEAIQAQEGKGMAGESATAFHYSSQYLEPYIFLCFAPAK